MKNLFRTGWIVLLVGAVLTAVGVAKNGVKSVEFNGVKPVVARKAKKVTRNYELKGAKTLVLALDRKLDGTGSDYSSVVNVEIRRGNVLSAKYSGSDDLAPVIRHEGDEIKVYAGRKSGHYRKARFDFDGINVSVDWASHLVITVPQDLKLERIESGEMAGNLTLDGVKVKSLKLHTGSDVSMRNVEADTTDVDNSGDVRIDSSRLGCGMIKADDSDVTLADSEVRGIGFELTDGDFSTSNSLLEKSTIKTDDGDITASNAVIRGRCQFTSADGDIDVTNAKADGFVSTTSDGDNLLHEKKGEATTLQENENAENVLVLMNHDGDNSIR